MNSDQLGDIIASLFIGALLLLYIYVIVRSIRDPVFRAKTFGDRTPARELREARQREQEQALSSHVANRWQVEGRAIHFGPVPASYYGDSPEHFNRLNPDWGVLGVVGDCLLFVGDSSANFQIDLPLDTVRWISQLNVKALRHNVLTIYREVGGQWRLYLLGTERLSDLVQAIQQVAPVSISTEPDYGPIKALRVRQNIYGQWERDYTVSLYLAPDRLLADGHSAIPLDCIRGLAVLPATGLNLTNAALLRIHHTDPDGRPQTVGFEMALDRATDWAEVLRHRTGRAIDDQMGRKKKGG